MWIGIKLSKKAIFQIVDISRNFRAKWSTFGQEEKPILFLIMQLKKHIEFKNEKISEI